MTLSSSLSTPFLLLLFFLLLHPSTPLSTTPSNNNSYNNQILLSRLQTTQCELLLSIGRIPNTAMPPEWAASGAKLVFPLEIEFTPEPCSYEMTKERLLKGDALMGTSLYAVEPLNEPTFVSRNGVETILVTSGAYGCQIQGLANKRYALRFFLDFPEGAVRNDVELPAERIYFLSSCWLFEDEGVLERARRRKETLERTIEEVTLELEDLDRAMSKQGIFQKALTFRESMQLVERKGRLRSELFDLEQKFPLDDSKIIRGPKNIVFAKEGFVAVKRFRGTLGTREQYHWVGTFTYKEFFDDEEEENDD